MKQCKYRYVSFGTVGVCGSLAFNLHKDVPSINQGDFCDKCYWRNIVESNMSLKPVRWLGVTSPQTVPEQAIKLLKEKVCVLETKTIRNYEEAGFHIRSVLHKISTLESRIAALEAKKTRLAKLSKVKIPHGGLAGTTKKASKK